MTGYVPVDVGGDRLPRAETGPQGRIAIVDVGSNSVRLKIAEADRDRHQRTGCIAPAQRAGLPIESKALEQEEVTASKRVHASPRPRIF